MPELPISRTKIVIPRRRNDLISRPRLLSALDDQLDNKLLIVAAPAGYGKTSLLIDYAAQTHLPICWYSLDALDQNLHRFLYHFVASIQVRFPSFGRSSLAALNNNTQESLNLDVLITNIVNDLYENITEHFAIVLDDYHLVSASSDINDFINRFVQETDENCHLVLASRVLLTLPDLPLMVARSQVSGLSFEELAFRQEEIKSLLENNYQRKLTEQEANELYRQSEGWITGLLLSAQISGEEADSRLRIARVSGVDLYEYLAQQVMAQQPEEIQLFLLRTSLLDEFDAPFCQEVVGEALGLDLDWSELLRVVMRSNLFVLPVGEESIWLRYHHLFQVFLQKRMQENLPQEAVSIQSRLAEVYTLRGEWERAYALYRRLNQTEEIARLVEQAGRSLITTGRLALLSQWVEALPNLVVTARPSLLSLQGGAAVVQGRTEQGLLLLNQAVDALSISNDVDALVLALLRRSNTHRLMGNYDQALQDVELVLQKTRGDASLTLYLAEAMRVRGMALYYQGHLHESLADLNHSLAAYQDMADEENAARVMMETGIVEKNLGNSLAAEQAYGRALKYWGNTKNSVWQANLLNNLGVLQHLRGDYEAAAGSLEGAIQHARMAGYPRLEAYALAGIGDIYRDLEAIQPAREAYQSAREIARQIKDQFLIFYLNLAEGVLERLRGRLPQAKVRLQEAKALAEASHSDYQMNLFRLEWAAVQLVENKADDALCILEEVAGYFQQSGQRAEAARAHLYALAAASSEGKETAIIEHAEKIQELLTDANQRHLVHLAGREFRKQLEGITGNRSQAAWLVELSQQMDNFDSELPRVRRLLRKRAITVPFAPPRMMIRSLGKMEVRMNERMITTSEWKTQTARDLFFLFLNHPEGMTKEQVGEIFWPDSSPSELKLRFKNTVYRLRHAIGRDTISFFDEFYRFNPDLDYEYDLEIFLREIAQAQHTNKTAEQIAHYRAAVRVYKGPFLPEVDEIWVITERERIYQQYLDALMKLGMLYYEGRQFDQGLEICQRMMAADSCSEEAYRLAMQIYNTMGNRAGIVRMYDQCKNALWDEVEALPSPQTQKLFEQLMR